MTFVARISLALLLAAAFSAHAQTWPAKPIHAIIPVGPGAPTDLIARSFGQAWAQTLGQPLVVENRAGASGIIGTEACAKAAPDGYTLCFVANGQITLNPFIFAKLPYDPVRDFTPVVRICDIITAIAVNASVPAKSMRELLDLSNARPGTINWSSWGIGTPSHLYMAWLEHRAGGKFVHVPYKEPGQAWNAIISGEAQAIANTTGLVSAMAKAGKVTALAVVGGKRSVFLPNVPTLKEQGIDLQVSGWIGLLVQTGTPRQIIQRLNAESNRLLADQAFVEKSVLPLGLEPAGGSPEEFAALLQTERATSAELIKLANVKPQ